MAKEYIMLFDYALYNEDTGEACFNPKMVGELVRCKDCKYFGEYCDEYKEESQTDGMCELDIKDSTTFDWFCADGERR